MSNTVWWTSFCGNGSLYDAFWSAELTINTFTPDFTNCFQNTILIWVPSIFLFIGGTVFSAYIYRNAPETPERGLSVIGLTQLAGLILLVLLSLCDLVFLLVKDRTASIQPVAYTAAAISLITYIFALILHTISCRGGFYNIGVTFVFWFVSLITGVVILGSRILQKEDIDAFVFVTTVIRFSLIALQFIFTLIPDTGTATKPDTTSASENTPLLKQQSELENSYHSNGDQQLANPTLTSTFPSRAFLFWFTSMVVKGYKGDIKLADIWRLTKYNSSQEIFSTFRKHLASSAKIKQIQYSKVQSSSKHSRDFTERSVSRKTTGSTASSLSQDASTGEPGYNDNPSGEGYLLFKALFRTFASEMVPGGVLIALYYGCLLLNPTLLKTVIAFVDSDDPYTWKGFALAAAMFSLAFLNPIFFHNHLMITFTVGMRIRGALTAAIYRKALKLSAVAKRKTTTGEIVNLMSIDVQKIQDTVSYLHQGWVVIFLVFFSIYFLWQQLGPSCLVGVVYLLGVLPASSQFVARTVMSLQRENMTLKDERIKIMNQVLTGIKVLKLYAWEPYFENRIKELRRKETDNIFKFWLVVALANTLLICTPFIVAVLCFTTYVLSDPDNVLTAQVAFVSLSYLNILSLPMYFMPFVLMQCAQAVISIKRIGKFLLADEINPDNVSNNPDKEFAICVKDATFSWGERNRTLLSGINLSIRRGSLVAVVGEVGSGKSSVLSALLGDMVKVHGTVNLADKQAYVPQQAWIQNLTVRDNILFGEELDEERYHKTLELCALEPDLEVLPGGDMTEIGERGINLSGGQKQRVSIARAVYQRADLYLLDDPLSAVDAHVGKHIFDNVIGPHGCLQHKTRVFVTNQIQYLKHTDDIIVMVNGAISEQGSYEQLLHSNGAFAQFVQTHLTNQPEESTDEEVKKEMELLQHTLSNSDTHFDNTRSDINSSGSNINQASLHQRSSLRKRKRRRKHTDKVNEILITRDERQKSKQKSLIEDETMEKGAIDIAVLKWYIKASSYITGFITLLGLLCFVFAQAATNIWLSVWTNDASAGVNDTVTSQDVRLGVYGSLGALQVIATSIFNVALAVGFVRAAKILHNTLLSNVLKCPMSFFDTTPIGRIINRFSKDVDIIDRNLPEVIGDSLMFGAPLLSTFVVIIYSVPVFTAVFIPVLVVFIIIQRVYTSCARQLKRLDSITRSPIYNFFSETLNGVTSIRAYGCQRRFIDLNDKQLDQSQSVWLTVFTANRWLGMCGEFVAAFVVLFTVIFATLQRDSLSAGLAGLAVTYSLQVSIDLTLFLRVTCEMETYIVAVERIKEYAEQQTEAAWRLADAAPSVVWPEQGVVSFSDYSTRYRAGLDLVLNNMTFTITAQEKVGIVGRTGAGKSSLALALFRLLEASSGNIVIDDLDIADCGLHDVRSKLTIIPQDPVLFSGSLWFNLDPSGERSEEQLWDALEHAHLKPFVLSLPKQLQYECGEDGDNLSVGQRQLVCLARALLRKSRVLVLDEATASVDVETDSLIQTTIQQEFKHCTVITVAHRLNTILHYDRIMVLESGHIAEFDTPAELLKNTHSLFYSMAKDAGLV